MDQNCHCPDQADKAVCELKTQAHFTPLRTDNVCPVNGQKGKSVQNRLLLT